MTTAALLALLALLLCGPVPALLARTPAVRLAPRAAMVLWQAVALAAVLSALGATLAVVSGAGLGADRTIVEYAVAGLALLVTALVLGRLLLTGHVVGTRLRAMRRHHRELVDLLASEQAGVLVVEGDRPVAYCLPGLTGSRVVISRAAADLGAEPLQAVLAHERAHLTARHDLVLEAFTVLHDAFPRWVSSGRALGEVRLLVEILADAAARRRHGALALARALVALTDSPAPRMALAAGGPVGDLTARVELLREDRPHRLLAGVLLALALAVLALPTAFVAYPWLASLPL
ncbi:MAG TPA: M56 family metallopeptidase [Marmoricola sp.]|nr:M56 family metallopeptidase [Marmoricola sp.]